MSILADNLRYLRAKRGYTQQRVADNLIITRGCYAKYEDGASEPPLSVLQKISHFYDVSIDILLQVEVKVVDPHELYALQRVLEVMVN